MQQKNYQKGPKTSNIWSKIDEILMKFVENVPKCESKNRVFSDVYFLMKKTTEKRRFYGPWGLNLT